MNKDMNVITTSQNVAKIIIMETDYILGPRRKIGYHFRKQEFNHQLEKNIDKSEWKPNKSMLSHIQETIKI